MTVVVTPNGTVNAAALEETLLRELLLVTDPVVLLEWVEAGARGIKRAGMGAGLGVTLASYGALTSNFAGTGGDPGKAETGLKTVFERRRTRPARLVEDTMLEKAEERECY